MIIGVPKEIKTLENRVALTPGGAAALVRQGHTVLVETDAGRGSGLFDEEYIASGASMVSAEEAWGAEMVIKVKEPIASEYQYLRDGLLLFTYLHLAAERDLTTVLLEGGTTAVAYETVQLANGALPLLMPMSEVAGRMATQEGANFLKKTNGGRGVLLGGTPGVAPARVTVIGGGVVGMNAAKMAIGLGADVTILDVNHQRLQYLDDVYGNRIRTVTSTEPNIREWVAKSDLVVGAVLIPGAKAPSLIVEDMVKTMQEGSVIVDVAIDQGGCCETIKPTTHEDPVFDLHGVVHYGVTNMPGAVPRTSTFALSNQTLPYAIQLANKGLDALRADRALALGLNTYKGKLTCPAVGEAFELFSVSPEDVL